MRVVEVPEDGPAYRADLRPEDRIVAVNGTKVEGRDPKDVHQLLSGEVGSKVQLEVLRDGHPLTIAIEREPYAGSRSERSRP